ncbi:MAG: TolC family protein [Kiritimatiellaeota bacterium]|nr:TolC family protein [Kiritimatiellota bacterium]
MKTKLLNLFSFLLIAAGCRTYTPYPIDWEQERAAWTGQSAAPLHLTISEAQQLALLLNPEINALRARHLASSNAVLQTGWWEDPELDVEALRIMKSVPQPWILASSLAFTIPINGVPALERKAAEAYAFADACAIIVAERELMAEVAHAWNNLEHAIECHRLLLHHLAAFVREDGTVKQLIAAGELDAAEGTRLQHDILRMGGDLRRMESEAEAQRLALVQLMGLHPSVSVEFIATEDASPPPDPTPSEDTLIRHPRVQEKLARLGGAEADLRTEIRRQYPNLKIGPALGNEDGETRAGLTFGMTLPLWNRNRQAIAVAEGARQQARIEAVNEWKRLVGELENAKRTLRLAEENERRCKEMEDIAQQSFRDIGELNRSGEADIVTYFEAIQTCVAIGLDWIEAQQALREAEINIGKFAE